MSYQEFFATATRGKAPFPYQLRLAGADWPEVVNIPTGMGKTAAVTLAWLYKRGWRQGARGVPPDPATPRRLLWCLPMRVLVEQTESVIGEWLGGLRIAGQAGEGMVSVHTLMGGAADMKTWAEHPEEDMVIIGTQDMLLSRALMRGYGMSRYQWPVHFALLHNDSLWVFDEVQLMGAGLTTSAQLEAFRRTLSLARRSRSLWLSATLNRRWLATVDFEPHLDGLRALTIDGADRELVGDRLEAVKHLACAPLALTREAGNRKGMGEYLCALREEILRAHDPSAQTLVILNRVDRAQGLYRLIREQRPQREDLLIHARFRTAERGRQARCLREQPAIDRIVIATQAIEAGVDLSSRVLVTELAPWSALVQRIGRCNRYGEHNGTGGGRVLWVDIDEQADALPYSSEELAPARERLRALTSVSPGDLPPADGDRPLTAVLRRRDLLDLFNTDPDLSGFDVDVSDYIRDGGVPGLQVFWRDFGDDPNTPAPQHGPVRDELCPISVGQARALIRRKGSVAWHWDSLDNRWATLDGDPRPGMTLLLAADTGGYDPNIGFDANLKQRPVPTVAADGSTVEDALGEDPRSRQNKAIGLADHLGHAAAQARRICAALGTDEDATAVIRAARWHDLGKAHAVFDATMHACDMAPPGFLAKSPCRAHHGRKFFRHELASMLAWLAQHDGEADADLIAYLIAAHHGKVRTSLRAMPTEAPAPGGARFARGVWEGDVLPALGFDGEHSDETMLRLELMEIGEGRQGPSWTERTLRLLDAYGPFRLAWLESLVRWADWRASAAEQATP